MAFPKKRCLLNPSSPKGGGLQQPPKQFSPWCSKSRSQGVKLLRVSSSSFFPFILAKNFEPTTYPGGRGKLSKLGGGSLDPVIFQLDYFENIWSDMHFKLCLQVRIAIF